MATCGRCGCQFYGGAAGAPLCSGCEYARRKEEEARARPKPFSREWRDQFPGPDVPMLRELDVAGISVLATLDHRSCRACLAHDGTFYTLDEWERVRPLPCTGCTCDEEDGVVPDPSHCRCTDIAHVLAPTRPDPSREERKRELLAWLNAPDDPDRI